MDLARPEAEGDAVIGQDGVERLGQAAQLQEWRVGLRPVRRAVVVGGDAHALAPRVANMALPADLGWGAAHQMFSTNRRDAQRETHGMINLPPSCSSELRKRS